MSDHSTITAEVNLAVRQRIKRVRRVKRCWRTFNAEEFIQDIEQSSLVQHPPSDVNELFALYDKTLYDKTLRSALDEHALLKESNILAISSSARWYNAECRLEKIKNPPTDEDIRVALCLAPAVYTSKNGVPIPFPAVLYRDHHREQTRHSAIADVHNDLIRAAVADQVTAYMLILRAFRSANWSMISSKLINANVVLSIERIVRSVRCSCVIVVVDRGLVRSIWVYWKIFHSCMATDTDIVNSIWRAVLRFGKTSFPYWMVALSNSSADDGNSNADCCLLLNNIQQSKISLYREVPLTSPSYSKPKSAHRLAITTMERVDVQQESKAWVEFPESFATVV